jgi:hypothetical protein
LVQVGVLHAIRAPAFLDERRLVEALAFGPAVLIAAMLVAVIVIPFRRDTLLRFRPM